MPHLTKGPVATKRTFRFEEVGMILKSAARNKAKGLALRQRVATAVAERVPSHSPNVAERVPSNGNGISFSTAYCNIDGSGNLRLYAISSSVPEPSTLGLLLSSLTPLLVRRSRREG